jgi:hypothetical protein
MKISKAIFGWTELMRTVAGLLTCLGIALSSACSSVQTAGTTADQTSAGSHTRAGQLQSFIHPGTDVQVTEYNGRVSQVHVKRIDNQVIAGKTSEGPVTISLGDIAEARVRKDPPKSTRVASNSGGTGGGQAISGLTMVVVVAAIVVLGGYWAAQDIGRSIDLSGFGR